MVTGLGRGSLGSFRVECFGLFLFSCLVPQVPLDMSPDTCHNNVMKQSMVDSSCRILTSDLFQDCNKLVRAAGSQRQRRAEGWPAARVLRAPGSNSGPSLGALEIICMGSPIFSLYWCKLGNRKDNGQFMGKATLSKSFFFCARHSSFEHQLLFWASVLEPVPPGVILSPTLEPGVLFSCYLTISSVLSTLSSPLIKPSRSCFKNPFWP